MTNMSCGLTKDYAILGIDSIIFVILFKGMLRFIIRENYKGCCFYLVGIMPVLINVESLSL